MTKRTATRLGLLTLLAALLAVALRTAPAPPGGAPPGGFLEGTAACTCAVARAESEWCAPCEVGYVARLPIRSRVLHETLDAHGHEIDPPSIRCATCRSSLASDGFCEECNRGFVGGRAYLSPLAYHLARGRPAGPPDCAGCRANAESGGWCEACGTGRLGGVELASRRDFDRVSAAYDVLLGAIATLPRCEVCAAAMVVDGFCRLCGLSYRDGLPVDGR